MGVCGSVLVVEDDPRVARAHARYLRARGLRVLVAHTAGEALARAASSQPDGFLLDVRLPDRDGLEVARAIRRTRPRAPVLVISGIRSKPIENAFAALGAWFAHKPAGTEVYEPLIDRVQRPPAQRSETLRPRDTLRAFIADKGLTPKELRVLIVTLRAESNADAARELGMSEDTLKKHITSILYKCGGAPSLGRLAGHILTAHTLPPPPSHEARGGPLTTRGMLRWRGGSGRGAGDRAGCDRPPRGRRR